VFLYAGQLISCFVCLFIVVLAGRSNGWLCLVRFIAQDGSRDSALRVEAGVLGAGEPSCQLGVGSPAFSASHRPICSLAGQNVDGELGRRKP
jgi:hypothetical protein